MNDGEDEEDEEDKEDKVEKEEEEGEAWKKVNKTCKKEMSTNDLHKYFDSQSRAVRECLNQNCKCGEILVDERV